MRTEYGLRRTDGTESWPSERGLQWHRETVEGQCRQFGWTLLAREVSDPRVVSIR